MSKDKFKIRRVGVLKIIEALNDLYEKGVDYVDIHKLDNGKDSMDTVAFSFSEDYMNEELKENFGRIQYKGGEYLETDENGDEIPPSLTDDDINQLI